MKFNIQTMKSRKKLLIIAAFLIGMAGGASAYYSLKTLLPKKDLTGSRGIVTDKPSKQALLEDAANLRKEADDAIAKNDYETAVKKLTEAKRLYLEAGDVQKSEETSDYLNYTQTAAAASQEKPEIPRYEYKP